jgi:hypothetical protein
MYELQVIMFTLVLFCKRRQIQIKNKGELMDMIIAKEELIRNIEKAQVRLNISIEHDNGDVIYQRSVELDKLIEEYIATGY